jgi:hypothetical protein
MSERSQLQPIISLELLGGYVRTSPDGKATLLDVTFACSFAWDAEPIEGTSIRIKNAESLTLLQLVEAASLWIFELLADHNYRNECARK